MKLENMLYIMPNLQRIVIIRDFNIFYFGDVCDFGTKDNYGIYTAEELLKMHVKQIQTKAHTETVIHIELF